MVIISQQQSTSRIKFHTLQLLLSTRTSVGKIKANECMNPNYNRMVSMILVIAYRNELFWFQLDPFRQNFNKTRTNIRPSRNQTPHFALISLRQPPLTDMENRQTRNIYSPKVLIARKRGVTVKRWQKPFFSPARCVNPKKANGRIEPRQLRYRKFPPLSRLWG